MTNSVFPKVAHDWLKHELDPRLFRRAGTILSGTAALISGTVLGKITKGTGTAAAKSGGNTGNGTITMDVTTPVLAGAKVGVYSVRCITAAANGGTFRVEDPDGFVIGDVAVGATFADDVKFVIADGASDFIVGDGFDITVAEGSGKYVPVAFAANNGSEVAAAIAIDAVDASAADKETAVLIGHAQIASSLLTWPAGATTNQKNAGLAQLGLLGVVDFQRY